MSDEAQTPSGLAARLPPSLAPRSTEQRASGRTRLIETTILVLVAILLATATVYDTVRQSHINERLVADEDTWRAYTGLDLHSLPISQELLGSLSKHEVVCGNTGHGAAKSGRQLCLAIWGPVRAGRRVVHGGWYLPPRVEDVARYRYGCFGEGARGMCAR